MAYMMLSTPNISQLHMRTEIAAAFEKSVLLFSAQGAIIGIYRKQRGRIHAKAATVPSDLWRTTS